MHTPPDVPFGAPFGDDHGPFLTGPYAPVFDESIYDQLEVTGEIPRDLHGVYLRNGPNPRFVPTGRYHPFDGDGMLHAAQFDGGRVVYRNRWVRTDGWMEEDRAQRATFTGIMSTRKGRSDLRLKDTGNTDVVVHGGLALASWYMAGALYQLDPGTLETVGRLPFSMLPGGSVSAHCKADGATGELLFCDYETEPPYMRYGVADRSGALVHHVPIALPGPRLPHDMAVTEHYAILHDLPLFHDEEALALGRHKLAFHPDMPARFGVIPRRGAGDSIRWFEFSPCFVYHVVNAWEEGDEVVMVGCRYMPARTSSGDIDAKRTAKMIAELHMDARLFRWRMNLRTGVTGEELLNDALNIEFPSFDTTRLGRPTRYAYLVDHHPTMLRWTGIRKLDTTTGQCLAAFSDGHETSWYSEARYAPKDGASAEDDGYLVTFVWNAATLRQELQVFDARNIASGPIARVRIPRRIPSGFHACWAGASQIGAR